MHTAVCLILLLAGDFTPRNDRIADFVDNTSDYQGRTLTLRLAFIGNSSLGTRVGDDRVPFEGRDPKNGARLLLGLTIPKGLRVPKAKDGEEVVITFTCGAGKNDTGNVAVAIRRP